MCWTREKKKWWLNTDVTLYDFIYKEEGSMNGLMDKWMEIEIDKDRDKR